MKLSDLLNEKNVIADMSGKDKNEAINELIDLFVDDPKVNDIEKVRKAVFDREKIISTGVGKGFAVPHGKTDAVQEVICAFGRSKEPIDYQALDQRPVHLVFLLVGKENLVSLHIKLLSRISRLMTRDEFRKKLMNANTVKEIIEIFKTEEETYFELL
ncbi:MAG: PTS sugar transporter subunit IIA [Ignavibacteriaceae bacterium]|nr:PTS sugar transporter subunit IIA [Ignavibacteriaceae bacterium]